jgi:hypothetical protein
MTKREAQSVLVLEKKSLARSVYHPVVDMDPVGFYVCPL